MKIYFQSSLPRSGSTLFQNVMGQNPDFFVTPTSGLYQIIGAAKLKFSHTRAIKAQNQDVMEQALYDFCFHGAHGFYTNQTDKPYVLDKSRGWAGSYQFLAQFYPEPKVIVLLRDPIDILNSLEKQFRKNQPVETEQQDNSYLPDLQTACDHRLQAWMNHNGILGGVLNRLKYCIEEGVADNFLFIRFEDFTNDPETAMEKTYSFLELPFFSHDFKNVEQITWEDDSSLGVLADHNIRHKIKPLMRERDITIGQHNCELIKKQYDWFYRYFKYK